MKITFFGAAQDVTGSRHLIEVEDYKLLLDCGMYQGKRSIANERNKALPFAAKDINAVILSHGHLDHCGALPILVRDGFRGRIYCTGATADVARCILEDSGALQEQIANDYNRHHKGQDRVESVYTLEDARRVFSYFEPHPYYRISHEWITLNDHIRFKLYDAGHILGSEVIVLEIKEEGITKTLAFTGDLGRVDVPILHAREYIEEDVQAMLMECTYGNSNHRPISEVKLDLQRAIEDAVRLKSKIIVPAFSLGRTQELIYILHRMTDMHEIPSIPIYIDSPLAESLTDVFSRHKEDFNDEVVRDFERLGESPFAFKNLVYTHSVEESKMINNVEGPCMIISASGMCEGGRILHHLNNGIGNPNNIILITGYQAENTLGRKIKEGASPVMILGESHEVRAKVMVLDELSAHADQASLLAYLGHTSGIEHLFLVHTEMPQATIFKNTVESLHPNIDVNIPTLGEQVEL
ncbi:MAG: MBL fold metallo-hydrolase [Patescibacteria group bacterium]|nr:MBL fold metallo-hydrolase [Patescibacteria group bacterium]MDE2438330.1 MBL fold metallo-hydrolase [Patescibacteria group bacterium]